MTNRAPSVPGKKISYISVSWRVLPRPKFLSLLPTCAFSNGIIWQPGDHRFRVRMVETLAFLDSLWRHVTANMGSVRSHVTCDTHHRNWFPCVQRGPRRNRCMGSIRAGWSCIDVFGLVSTAYVPVFPPLHSSGWRDWRKYNGEVNRSSHAQIFLLNCLWWWWWWYW